MWGWCFNTSSSLARPGSVSGTCPCCVLCPEPQQHAPFSMLFLPSSWSLCLQALPSGSRYNPSWNPDRSPGPQPEARCLSVGVGRGLALGSPDSGFPGHCGAPPAGACIPVNVPSPHFPACLLPLPARTQQGELFQGPLSRPQTHSPGMGRAPVSRPLGSQACRGTTTQPGPQRTGAPKAPPVRHGVPILSAVGRALCFVEHLLALFFFSLFNISSCQKSMFAEFGCLFWIVVLWNSPEGEEAPALHGRDGRQ